MQIERARCRTGFRQRIHRLCRLQRMTAILLIVLFGMAAGCSKAPEEKSQHRSAEVTVITVEAKDVPVSGEYVAQTQSSRLVNIQARVTGFLDRRVYTEGAMVKEGDTLFLMDQKPFQAAAGPGSGGHGQAGRGHGNGEGEPGAGQTARGDGCPVPEGPR